MRMRTFFESIDWQHIHQMTLKTDFQLHYKSPGDFATDLDLNIEKYLLKLIKQFDPQGQILSEEAFESNPYLNLNQAHQADENRISSDRLWIVDPLDGTLNMTLGMPYYGIQLCCQSLATGKHLLALIYLPSLGELYYWDHLSDSTACYQVTAGENGVALKPKPAYTSVQTKVYSFGDFSKSNPSSRTFQARLMEMLAPQVGKIRIQGSSSIDFAFLLSGRTQAHFLFSTRPWELQPGIALAKGAGLSVIEYPVNSPIYTGTLWVIAQKSEIAFVESVLSHIIS